MRCTAALLTLVTALPLSGQQYDPLAFLRRGPGNTDLATVAYPDIPYRPVRIGEVRTAGFLTEGRALAFGRVLGPVIPPVVPATESAETILPGALIAITAPSGGSYQQGDTVMLARLDPAPEGWGQIVVPTGLAVVGNHTPRQTFATLVAMYNPVHMDQVVFPVQPVVNPGDVKPVPVTGPAGEVIVGREVRELEQVGGVLFINLGRTAGIRLGDFVQFRRRPGPRLNAADTEDDVMATGEVVHVDDRSSSVKLIRVIDPVIRPGTPVVRFATLPD